MQTPPPDFLQVFPTLRCNRKCGFCFNRGVSGGAEIAVHDYRRLAAVVAEIGVRGIDLLCGDRAAPDPRCTPPPSP
ncbi:MAG: hypothetical protein U0411_12560 [Thermodesulfovibrionales bacterium]